MQTAPDLFSYRKHWAARFGVAPVLPMSRAEMDELGWESCDVVIVTGDAYVDHPSFGMSIIGRLLEAQGFRVGLIAQPDWRSAEPFLELGRPNLFFGITAGNMDSMVNRYTADRRIRSDDAYTPGGVGGKRPDRSVIVYAQRAREAFGDVPIVIGGIEASLRRTAHFDYWSEKIRRSILLDARADLLVYGNAERQIVEIAHRLAAGETVDTLTDIRGTAFVRKAPPDGWFEIDSTTATATAMYHSGKNPLKRVSRSSEEVIVPKGLRIRRLHKAFLRYHDANNWPMLREALRRMGRADLIGNGKRHLVPSHQPAGTGSTEANERVKESRRRFMTQHTGLPKTPRPRRAHKSASGSQ